MGNDTSIPEIPEKQEQASAQAIEDKETKQVGLDDCYPYKTASPMLLSPSTKATYRDPFSAPCRRLSSNLRETYLEGAHNFFQHRPTLPASTTNDNDSSDTDAEDTCAEDIEDQRRRNSSLSHDLFGSLRDKDNSGPLPNLFEQESMGWPYISCIGHQ